VTSADNQHIELFREQHRVAYFLSKATL